MINYQCSLVDNIHGLRFSGEEEKTLTRVPFPRNYLGQRQGLGGVGGLQGAGPLGVNYLHLAETEEIQPTMDNDLQVPKGKRNLRVRSSKVQ